MLNFKEFNSWCKASKEMGTFSSTETKKKEGCQQK
jgi:hypothetical protein